MSQYTNYEADYAYFSRLPETTFPNDYVYDTPYQENPKNQLSGSMDSWGPLRRHRTPQILVQPKPVEYDDEDSGYSYQIPNYPPYVYWYPNPMECRDTCGTTVCNGYFKKMNDYRMCQFCQDLKHPQCWDSKTQRCVPCPRDQALGRCEDRFGCANPNGWMQDRVAPINPKYTGCKNCF